MEALSGKSGKGILLYYCISRTEADRSGMGSRRGLLTAVLQSHAAPRWGVGVYSTKLSNNPYSCGSRTTSSAHRDRADCPSGLTQGELKQVPPYYYCCPCYYYYPSAFARIQSFKYSAKKIRLRLPRSNKCSFTYTCHNL